MGLEHCMVCINFFFFLCYDMFHGRCYVCMNIYMHDRMYIENTKVRKHNLRGSEHE